MEYKGHYKAIRNVVVDSVTKEAGISSFADNKACAECEVAGKKICKDKTVLMVNSRCRFTVVELERFFDQFDGTSLAAVKDKCDLMLYDEEYCRLAFCEMTCTQEKYILPYKNSRGHNDGKRAKAYNQLKSSICKLAAVPGISSKMDLYRERSALFAVRLKNESEGESTSTQMMAHRFSRLARSIQDGAKLNMGNGFTFEVVQYPRAFQW